MPKIPNSNLLSHTGSIFVMVLVGLTFLPVVWSSNAEASQLKPLKYGAWTGGVYINDETGRFSHCVVSAKYKSGIKLLFSVTRGQHWSMGFAKSSWKFDVGKSYPVLYQVDKKQILKGKAKARGKSLAVVNLPAKTTIFNQMRRGRVLRVKAGKDILSFNLKGTNKVLAALLGCSKKYNDFVADPGDRTSSDSNRSENPFSKESAKISGNQFAAKRPVSPEERREGKIWFNQHLVDSNVRHRSVKENEKSARLYKTYAALWLSGPRSKIIGSLRILDNEKSKFFAKNFPPYRKKACGGEYTFRIIPNDINPSRRMLRFVATCQLNEKPTKTFYHMLASRSSQGSYFVSLISDKVSTSDVVRAGNDVATQMLKNGDANDSSNNGGTTLHDAADEVLDSLEN